MTATGIFVGALFLAKNALFAIAVWSQNRLTARSISSVFQRLIHTYLAAPYVNQLQRNTSDRIYAAMEGVDVVYRLVLASAAGLLTEIAVAILLPLATIGIMRHPSNAILTWILNISTIAAAFAAALIPILFYAATPTLPEIDR